MKNTFNKILAFSFYLFLVFLPFGYRHLIHQFSLPFLKPDKIFNAFDEYRTTFIYLNDILIILLLTLTIIYIVKNWLVVKKIFLSTKVYLIFLFVALGLISIIFAPIKALAFYYFIRLFLAAMFGVSVIILLKEKIINLKNIFSILAILGTFEGVVSFLQFYFQHSLGLKFLGESFLGYDTPSVARIWVDGAKLLRAYGTFPHSNILAAFLVMGVVASIYSLIKSFNKNNLILSDIYRLIFWSVILFFNILGLLLSFSRSGWLALVLALSIIVFLGLLKKEFRRQAIIVATIFIFTGIILLIAFGWAILPRSHLYIEEASVEYRLIYMDVGINLISNHLLGVGIGNQVVESVILHLYQNYKITSPWLWQPIHNLYLLIFSELGIFGFLVFSGLILLLIIDFIRRFSDWKFSDILMFGLFLAFLFLGLFDHYFWDLWPGMLMFWLVLGIFANQEVEN